MQNLEVAIIIFIIMYVCYYIILELKIRNQVKGPTNSLLEVGTVPTNSHIHFIFESFPEMKLVPKCCPISETLLDCISENFGHTKKLHTSMESTRGDDFNESDSDRNCVNGDAKTADATPFM